MPTGNQQQATGGSRDKLEASEAALKLFLPCMVFQTTLQQTTFLAQAHLKVIQPSNAMQPSMYNSSTLACNDPQGALCKPYRVYPLGAQGPCCNKALPTSHS